MVKKAVMAVLVLAWAAAVLAVLLYGPIRGPVCGTDPMDGEQVCRAQ